MRTVEFHEAVAGIIGHPPDPKALGVLWELKLDGGGILTVERSPFPTIPFTLFLRFRTAPFPGLGENPDTGKWNIIQSDFGNDPQRVLRELTRRLAAAGYDPVPAAASLALSNDERKFLIRLLEACGGDAVQTLLAKLKP